MGKLCEANWDLYFISEALGELGFFVHGLGKRWKKLVMRNKYTLPGSELEEVTACIRAGVRKKERGSFEKLAYWRTPLKDKAVW
jgi:hypothetical protein